MGNKTNMKQIVIITIILVIFMITPILAEIRAKTDTGALTLEVDPMTTRTATSFDMAKDQTSWGFMESNWGQATEQQKKEYINKRYQDKTEFIGDPGDYKLNAAGDLVDKNGNVVIEKGVFDNYQKFEFLGNDQFKIFSSEGAKTWKWDVQTGRLITAAPVAGGSAPTPAHKPSNGKSISSTSLNNGPSFNQNNGGLKPGTERPLGGGGASPTPKLDAALQQSMQLIGQVQSLIPKPKDEIPPEEDPSSFAQGPGFAETYLASLREGSVEVAKEGVTIDNGAIVGFQTGTQQTLLAGQTNLETPATIKEAGGNTIETNNLAFIRPNEIAAETTDSTTVELNGIRGDSNFPATSTSALSSLQPSFLKKIKSLFQLNALITGKVIGSTGQSIQLIDHDLNVDGHDMDIYPLKTFNNVEFGGNNLHLFNGNIHMAFNGQRIMYSRLVHNAPYGIKRIKNKLEINQNEFILQHYTDKSGELTDKNKIISVGDIIKSPRKGPYTKLKFNKHRINTMFS